MATHETGATALPDDWPALGAALKRLREQEAPASLEQLLNGHPTLAASISKSSLGRYELGRHVVSLHRADDLDELYGGAGWVSLAIRTLWRRSWNPYALHHAAYEHTHAAAWPAQYSGQVWLTIHAAEDASNASHRVDLEWGPWVQTVDTVIPASGVVITTGKARDTDGISRTCNIRCDRQVFLLYGAGDDALDESNAIDVRRGWRLAPGEHA